MREDSTPKLSPKRAKKYKHAAARVYGPDSPEAACANLVNIILMRGKYTVDESAQALTQLIEIISRQRNQAERFLSLIACTQAMLYMQGWEVMVKALGSTMGSEERGQ